MTPSQKFKILREKLGMFQVDAARLLNVTVRQVQLVESGSVNKNTVDEYNYKLACELILAGHLGMKDKASFVRSSNNINKLVKKVVRGVTATEYTANNELSRGDGDE